MKKFSATGNKTVKIIHFFFISLWIGGAISLLLLSFLSHPENGDELYGKLHAMKLIDDFIIIPGAMGNLLIGIVYGIWTKWGFFKHRWVTVKWILTVMQILFGTFFLGPWLNGCEAIANAKRELAFSDSVFQHHFNMNAVGGVIQAMLLIAMVVISVIKPWRSVKK
jgi:hypothetical protein